MKKIIRTCSAILCLCLVVSLLPRVAIAVDTPEEVNQNVISMEDFWAGFCDPADLAELLDSSTVPEAVGYKQAIEKNHVQRLYADEGNDLNKVVFLNIDGTKTMYTFDYPVKYIDESGKIKDITLEIADSETAAAGFVTEANNAVTTFSNHLSDGISLSGNGVEINLVPALPKTNVSMEGMSAKASVNAQSSYTAKRIDEKTIEYPYDANTTIEYSLTYTGFKEDIVVTEYTGQTEYEFTLYTNGYSLSQINGAYYLTDQQGNIKASIGDVIIFTADQRNNTYGYIAPKTIVENEEYLLTIVVDEAFFER